MKFGVGKKLGPIVASHTLRISIQEMQSDATIIASLTARIVTHNRVFQMRRFFQLLAGSLCNRKKEKTAAGPYAVRTSSRASQARASSRWLPHISSDACRPLQHAGRTGEPKTRQRRSSLRYRQGSPAGLFRLLMDGAIQQAPQSGRHSMLRLAYLRP